MVKSTEKLEKVLKLGDTFYLRKNINQAEVIDEVTGDTHNEWQAEEISFTKRDLDLQKVKNNFNIYWDWAVLKKEKQAERIEKERLVRKLVDKEYDLADLKETVDQLVTANLGV